MNNFTLLMAICLALNYHLSAQSQFIYADKEESKFGNAVDISSDGTTFVAAANWHNETGLNNGKVSVYTLIDSQWILKGTPIIGNKPYMELGVSVSISGDGRTIAIGSPLDNSKGWHSGKVSVFEWNQGQWLAKGQELLGENPLIDYGMDVSLSEDGNTMIVSAATFDEEIADIGKVVIYEYKNKVWKQKGNPLVGGLRGERMGFTVAMSDDGMSVAIGSPHYSNFKKNIGCVGVYIWDGKKWKPKGQKLMGIKEDDKIGWDLDLSYDGNKMIIGSPYYDDEEFDMGLVEVYSYKDGKWLPESERIVGKNKGDRFGAAVSMSQDGTKFMASAYTEDKNGKDSGCVTAFMHIEDSWLETKWKHCGNSPNDWFGKSLSLSNNDRFVVGAPFADDQVKNSGAVFISTMDSDQLSDLPESISENK